MNESPTHTTRHVSPCASLAARGVKLRQRDRFEPIRKQGRSAQKTVKQTPLDTLSDAFMALLAGAHGLGDINTRLRADQAVPWAFGRTRCAEHSVVQDTLDPCPAEHVRHMEQALESTVRALGRTLSSTGRSWMWR
jgi:hypothetical protein